MDPENADRFRALEEAGDYLHLYATVLARQHELVEAAAVMRSLSEFGEDPHAELAAALKDIEGMDSLERDCLLLTFRDLGKELIDLRKHDAAEAVTKLSEELETMYGPPEEREDPKH